MREEALLGGLKGRACGGLCLRIERAALSGDVGGLESGVEVVVDDLEGAGVGIVDANLLGSQRMLDQFVLDALVGQRTGRIEAERLQVAGQHLHGGDATGFDRLHELRTRGEGEVLTAPKAEPLGIGEVLHGGGARGRYIHDPCVRQRVLEPQAGTALLGRRLVAALATPTPLAAGGVGHGMAFVEHDHSVEVRSQPIDDLADPRNPFLARVGP